MNKWLKIIQNWIAVGLPLPSICLMCLRSSHRDFALCERCEAYLPWLGVVCQRCALPTMTPGVCFKCQHSFPTFDRLQALFHYAWPINIFISRFKYEGKLHFAKILGQLMASHFSLSSPIDCIIPMPLHVAKQKERGFNQSLELAKHLAKEKKLSVDWRSCTKIRDTQNQSSLTASARLVNIAPKAFRIARHFDAKHVLVIEDVVTTGSTVNAFSGALKEHGVVTVEIWSCCRTSV